MVNPNERLAGRSHCDVGGELNDHPNHFVGHQGQITIGTIPTQQNRLHLVLEVGREHPMGFLGPF